MCGIAGIFGSTWKRAQLEAMVAIQQHRGPDAKGIYVDATGIAGLGHNRLSIIDLSESGRQPMSDITGRYLIVFNGEIYNYLELRQELRADFEFRTRTDTEVVLAAYQKWGKACLDKFIGIFSFAIWNEQTRTLFAARDRFGVKPLYYHTQPDGSLLLASEIKALIAAGVPACPNSSAWATYLAKGLYDHTEYTFWNEIRSLPPSHALTWREHRIRIWCWYNLAERVGQEFDYRPLETVQEEYLSLLTDSVRLRFRSDVPVGINLSGGLDSSTLLRLVQTVQGSDSEVKAFTFITGDPQYDELPWVQRMLAHTKHPLVVCRLTPSEVPQLAESVQWYQDEPFAGIPTLAYARVFERARSEGVIVLLDGQGMDEQWAGYDYYVCAINGTKAGVVQGTKESVVRPQDLMPEFRALAKPFGEPRPFSDPLRNLQYRDVRHTKIPRALRFHDRISMRVSTELREPFLDHRLFELALRQPQERKIVNGTHKWLLRQLTEQLLPNDVLLAPKRPLHTPQREWLRGPLRDWANEQIQTALEACGGEWLDGDAVRTAWKDYCTGRGDNSFFVWQWISLGLIVGRGGMKQEAPK